MVRSREVLAGMAGTILWVAGAADAQPLAVPRPGGGEVITGQFIVELQPAVGRNAFVTGQGLAPSVDYTIINGFTARMSPEQAARLAADPQVRRISPDLVVRALVRPTRAVHRPSIGPCAVPRNLPVLRPEAPAGVRRIGAPAAWARGTTGAGVKVAVIDTGIDPCHPDLKANLKGGVNLVLQPSPPPDDDEDDDDDDDGDDDGADADLVKGAVSRRPRDDNGHGTHVAGIIGAARNGFGVAGVAPDAELFAVKVLDAQGTGRLSTVIKGLDWAVEQGMHVANLSLGADDPSRGEGPMCTAVSNAVAAGVVVVAAAGNEATEALFVTPGNCPDALTASGFVETDGSPGGRGASVELRPDLVERDDTFAETFSNFSDFCWDLDDDDVCTIADSNVIDLMAPAVDVLSTLPTSPATLNEPDFGKRLNYDTLTGTSMAAPHLAGAAALFLDAHPGATPRQIRLGLTTRGTCVDGSTSGSDTCPLPWPDDTDATPEPLLSVDKL
jgi:subtilisin